MKQSFILKERVLLDKKTEPFEKSLISNFMIRNFTIFVQS